MKKNLILGLVLVLSACSSQHSSQNVSRQGPDCNDKQSCVQGVAEDVFTQFEAGKQFSNAMVLVEITFKQGGEGIDAAIVKSTGNKEFNKLALENVKQIIAYEENPLANLPDEDKDEFGFRLELKTPDYIKYVKHKHHEEDFPNGQVREMGWLTKNGNKVGEWVRLYDDGQVQRIANYPSGKFISYYRSGELKSKGSYLDSQKSGKWVQYFKNGKLEHVGEYLSGDKVGEWVYFDESGNKTVVNE